MTCERVDYRGEVLSETVVDDGVRLRIKNVSGTERAARN
jgi:hypothetical protein